MEKTTATEVEKFLSAPAIAVLGVSNDQKKFGNKVYRAMVARDLKVYPLNPKLQSVEGDTCYASLADLPEKVEAAITVIPPRATEKVVSECAIHGVTTLWMQPGSESERAIADAKAHGMRVVHGQCIMMFLEPVTSAHSFHRFFSKLLGSYPRR